MEKKAKIAVLGLYQRAKDYVPLLSRSPLILSTGKV
jgi:hypothetical protein